MSIIYTDKDGIDHKTAGKEVPGIASNTDFGVVQFTDSKGVTSDNGLALSAKEKNKDISGTLAAEINTVAAKLGDANIAAGDGTAAGAINELNQNLGDKSSASGVVGDDAFAKINSLYNKLKIIAVSSGTDADSLNELGVYYFSGVVTSYSHLPAEQHNFILINLWYSNLRKAQIGFSVNENKWWRRIANISGAYPSWTQF